jgi:hypothetical protein
MDKEKQFKRLMRSKKQYLAEVIIDLYDEIKELKRENKNLEVRLKATRNNLEDYVNVGIDFRKLKERYHKIEVMNIFQRIKFLFKGV